MNNVCCESLEARRLNADVALDPNYLFSYAEIKDKVGEDFRVIEAVPARGDRTFLLAVRDETNAHSHRQGLVTVIAVNADGNLDPTFGDGGVALTNRLVLSRNDTRPARMAVDGAGRVYVADNTRVFRLRRNGGTDRTFGTNGAAGFAPETRPVLLCDLTPTDNGVLVATTETARSIERFSVVEIGSTKSARVVWQARHNGGYLESQHGRSITAGNGANTAPDVAQFASSGGTIVLARIERNGEDAVRIEPDGNFPVPIVRVTRQDLVLTTFDAAGRGTDEVRQELLRPTKDMDEIYATALGNTDYRYPLFGSVAVVANGRRVIVQTGQELRSFDLKTGQRHRLTLPRQFPSEYEGVYRQNTKQLLGDGTLGVYARAFASSGGEVTYISRFSVDGTQDPAYGRHLPDIGNDDYATGKNNTIDQIFAGASGRLYFLSTGTIASGTKPTNLTLRRLV